MTRLFHFFYALIVFLFLHGCNTNQKIDREAIKDEMKNREIKRVTSSEITEKALVMGNSIADAAQKKLQQNLLAAINENGIPGALEFCNANALTLVKDLEDSLGVEIYRVSTKFRNPKDEPDSLEALMLDAYAYNVENEIQLEPSIQEVGEEVLLYTKPIKVGNPLCLQCHGKIGDEILNENYDVISSFYPEDKAHGYALGELRGMWSIRIPKKSVVLSL